MAIFRSLRNELHKFGKHKYPSIDHLMPASDFPLSGVKAELPNPGRHGAPSRQQEYDPIVAAYQAVEAAYEQPQTWFDGPVTPPQPASTSEARFSADDGIDAVVIDHLQIQHEIQDAIDQAKAIDEIPQFAREFVDESEPELDCAEPLEDMDSLLMPTEFAELPDETPERQPPVSAEGFPSLEQIVQAEMPESLPAMPVQPEYDAAPMTPVLLEQALQQASTQPQPEDPEEQLRRQYDAQLDQLLNPYNAMLFNPFGMPGPG
jgi:hypothetical protein